MANPTTNFGWVMPTSTSLVTNLPADFNTFGQGVDTSLAQLKGGTTGQILSKTSATDMAFTWITNDVGDITAVTAGTGISGGGTSGAVTITNSMATEITASGDIIVGTGSSTFDNLPIGTTGQVLTADTTVSPYKVKWATPAGGASFAGCLLTMTAGLTATNASYTYWTWNSEVFDVGGYHDLSTNTNRITIPTGKSGYYLFVGYTGIATTGTASGYVLGNIEARNSAGTYQGNKSSAITVSGSVYPNIGISSIVYADAGDYFQLAYRQNSGGTYTTAPGTDAGTYFSCTYLGA